MTTIGVGSLVPRVYGDFRGIDVTKRNASLTRSPDALNMWINYKDTLGKCIETRPGLEAFKELENTVYGIYKYVSHGVELIIIHSGTKLYRLVGSTLTLLYTGLTPSKTTYFVFNNMLYIKDNAHYLKFDGVQIGDVEGYIPTTSVSGIPSLGSRTTNEPVNLLSNYRINTFIGDGESTLYQLDTEYFDNEAPTVYIEKLVNDVYEFVLQSAGSDYTYDASKGTVTFTIAPDSPATDGRNNVKIQYKKTINENQNKINKCQILTVFNDTIFVAGNPDYPNVMFASITSTPNYFADIDYYNEGNDSGLVKALVPGNNALWVFKESGQGTTTCFYHVPQYTTRQDTNIAYYDYVPTTSSISLGCTSTGINFNDDIVFFSSRGMEGISGDITTEQAIAHRSSMLDAVLLNEVNYNKLKLAEYEGYLLVNIDNRIYLADSRSKFQNEDHIEYDWYIWEFESAIDCMSVIDGTLYISIGKKIYTLTDMDENRTISSYWTTPEDEFKVGQYVKTTSKKGCVINMKGNSLTVSTKTDNNEFEVVDTYTNTGEYVVARIKKKKWKSIQLKFSSNKPFGLFSCTLQAYVGGYVKR